MVSKDMFGILASSFSSKEKVVLNETKQKKKKKDQGTILPLVAQSILLIKSLQVPARWR